MLDDMRPLSLLVSRTFCSPQPVSTAYCVAEHCVETLYPQFPPLCLESLRGSLQTLNVSKNSRAGTAGDQLLSAVVLVSPVFYILRANMEA